MTVEKIVNPDSSYPYVTRRPWVCFVFVLPFAIFFHTAGFFYRSGLLVHSDFQRVLNFFGASGWYLPPLFLTAVLLGWQWVKKDPWKFKPLVLAGMLAESIVYVIPLAIIGKFINRFLLQATSATQPDNHLIQKLMQAVGAGIYEEFLFRLLLIGAIFIIAHYVFEAKMDYVIIAAAIVSGITFSLYHFLGNENFVLANFIFRAFAGIYLAVIYLCRGFGISVGTHVVWNVCITIGLL